MFVVYKITNLTNGKAYIGISSRPASVRWSEHKVRTRQGVRNSRLYSAIRKYGPEAFSVETLTTTASETEVRELETQYIKQFDTYENGYNSNLGGHGFLVFPDEIRKKIGLAQVGKVISVETRQKMSKAKRGKKECADHLGQHTSKGSANPRSKSYLMRFPDGSEQVITGMREFCRLNGLAQDKFFTRGKTKGFVLLRTLNDQDASP